MISYLREKVLLRGAIDTKPLIVDYTSAQAINSLANPQCDTQ